MAFRNGGRRSRFQIWVSILQEVRSASLRGTVRATRVQSATNLPHDRFWSHVAELEARGLLQGTPLAVTQRGCELLDKVVDMQAMLARFGLADEGLQASEATGRAWGAPAPAPPVPEPAPALAAPTPVQGVQERA